jgi:hypothetical protein
LHLIYRFALRGVCELGRDVKDVIVFGIGQESAALLAGTAPAISNSSSACSVWQCLHFLTAAPGYSARPTLPFNRGERIRTADLGVPSAAR